MKVACIADSPSREACDVVAALRRGGADADLFFTDVTGARPNPRALNPCAVRPRRLLLVLKSARTLRASAADMRIASRLARYVRAQRFGQVHAVDALRSATVASLASRMAGVRFTFSVSGGRLPASAEELDAKTRHAHIVRTEWENVRTRLAEIAPADCRRKLCVLHLGAPVLAPPSVLPSGFEPAIFLLAADDRSGSEMGVQQVRGGLEAAGFTCRVLSRTNVDPNAAGVSTDESPRAGDLLLVFATAVDQSDGGSTPLSGPVTTTILRAMAAGSAVLCHATPETNELIEDGKSGVLLASADPHRWTTVARELAADPLRRAAYGRSARLTVLQAFNADTQARAFVHLLRV